MQSQLSWHGWIHFRVTHAQSHALQSEFQLNARWVQFVFKGRTYDRSRIWKWPPISRGIEDICSNLPPILPEIKDNLPPNTLPIFIILRTHFHFTPLSRGIKDIFSEKIPLFLPFQGLFWILPHISRGNEDNFFGKIPYKFFPLTPVKTALL